MIGDMHVWKKTKPVCWEQMIYTLPLLVSLLAVSTIADGAIIKFIKKRKIVVLDDSDVSKRDKVCFFAGSKKRACGRVIKVKKDKSYVKIKKKKHFRRVKKDMSYEISSADGSSRSSGGGGLKLRVLLTPSLFARSSFNYIEWKGDKKNDDDNGEESTDGDKFGKIEDSRIEKEEKEVDSSLERLSMRMARYFPWTSAGLEGELSVNDSLSIAMGGRYTHFNLSPQVDFNFKKPGETEPFMRSTYGGREISFWLDCLCVEVSAVKLGGGVGFTMSKINLTTGKWVKPDKASEAEPVKENNEDKDIVYFSGNSSVNVMSFRLSARKDFSMGFYGFGLGLTAIISPFSFGSEFVKEGEVHPELSKEYTDEDKESAAIEDISKALDHRHNIFSLMLSVSLFFSI